MNTTVSARLGETPIQCADRYGAPKTDPSTKMSEKTMPLMEGAILHTYEFQGWIIRAAFLDINGPAVRIEYQKSMKAGGQLQIQVYEVEAILKGECPQGTTWKPVIYNNQNSPNRGLAKVAESSFMGLTGASEWQRTDSAIAQLRPGSLFLRLEFPSAHQFEQQLKAQKEFKARGSVPNF